MRKYKVDNTFIKNKYTLTLDENVGTVGIVKGSSDENGTYAFPFTDAYKHLTRKYIMLLPYGVGVAYKKYINCEMTEAQLYAALTSGYVPKTHSDPVLGISDIYLVLMPQGARAVVEFNEGTNVEDVCEKHEDDIFYMIEQCWKELDTDIVHDYEHMTINPTVDASQANLQATYDLEVWDI